MSNKRNYTLSTNTQNKEIPASRIDYLPRDPKKYHPLIGLIGCGGISVHHLAAYKKAGYRVVALCDVQENRAKERQKDFFPKAEVFTDYRKLLRRGDIEVVDVATHPLQRAPILEAALRARKHVLSQKPFVVDLDLGERLVNLAAHQGVLLAVNQNGRWSPHLSYIRNAILEGLIGDVTSIHFALNWDHTWILGTPFDQIHHLILYDFAIHWFDATASFLPEKKPRKVFATVGYARGQKLKPPMFAQTVIEYDQSQATLAFNGHSKFGASDRTLVAGLKGTLQSMGENLNQQQVTLFTTKGWFRPKLKGAWFSNGFHGTMAELLCSIDERRQPLNSARDNLRGLAICFAAIASANLKKPMVPGKVRRLPRGAV